MVRLAGFTPVDWLGRLVSLRQLGLGSTTTLSCVFVPTEIPLSRAFPSGTSVRCTDVAAGEALPNGTKDVCCSHTYPHHIGGDIAYFTIESFTDPHSTPVIDIFACGMGQYGALGNGLYSQAQGTPVKVKNISGNMTCMSFLHRTLRRCRWQY
jgi:Regulator of chromosome condensation (RCC1) repeat